MASHTPHSSQGKHPGRPPANAPDAKTAADLIRQKVSRLYGDEPDAQQELGETENVARRSKHQQFMYHLGTSGKDLATIQTEWHDYYQGLPEAEKQEVWQEFYASQSLITGQRTSPRAVAQHKHEAAQPKSSRTAKPSARKLRDARSTSDIQETIRDKVTAGGKLQARHHLQSLLFGLGIGLIVVIIFLFSFFNEVVIAPFIQPSRTAAATPLIVSDSSVAAKAEPEVIIPKINVEIPVDYSQTTTNEAAIENALEDGVVHYPSTALPGQNGNAAFFGHSSNNIFNKGKYKFAFVLLRTLQPGDTFYLTYNSKVYAYKVITKTVVEPSDVGVLGPVAGQQATATLITCDPPGTSLHRLVVVGQQISPNPSGNSEASSQPSTTTNTSNLPGNGPTLFTRLLRTAVGKGVIIITLVAAFIFVIRWVNKPKHTAGS
jgi:LPXTG-site transpeptidase (sortase) family protein